MSHIFFYASIVVLLILFLFVCTFKSPKLPNVIIGLTAVGYSLIIDIILGDQLKLYYYIDPQLSTMYIVVSAVFVYPILNIIYTLFLPKKFKSLIIYTFCWITSLLVFEYACVKAKTIVFTGWQALPWSIIIYLVTYIWIYYFYIFLIRKCPAAGPKS